MQSTLGQFNNPKYLTEKIHRLTASNFGAVERKNSTSCDVLVKKILNLQSFSTPATEYGKANEAVALSNFEVQKEKKIQPSGLIVYLQNGFLAASRDGMNNIFLATTPFFCRNYK